MRNGDKKRLKTGKVTMSRPEPRKIIIQVPQDLLSEADRIASDLKVNRSDFVRTALDHEIRRVRRAQLEEELKEGSIANAEADLATYQEFESVGLELLEH